MKKLDGRSKAARAAKQVIETPDKQKPTADFRQVGGSHYSDRTVQPWDAMHSWMSPEQFEGFLRGNVIRYMSRYTEKNGLEDVKKAQHYIDKLIEVMEAR